MFIFINLYPFRLPIFFSEEFFMAGKSLSPPLSDIQKTILTKIILRRDSPQQLVRRVRIVLLAAEGYNNKQIAPQVDLCQETVRTWRTRWNKQQETLNALENALAAQDDEKALKEYIVDVVLADEPYNGVRGKYTPEQITQLYKISCEPPEDSGRPISHWSLRKLSDERVKRGIVDHMPISTVWDFLKSSRLEAAQSGRLDPSQAR